MAALATYKHLALGWSPDRKRDRTFNQIALVVLVVLLIIGLVLSSIEIPKKERKARTTVPERIAQFILEREKPKIEKPKPKPLPKPKPRAKKPKKKKAQKQKPLTKIQKTARKIAEASGLLALSDELSDLMDTSSVNALLGSKLSKTSSRISKAATLNSNLLTADAGKGSGGINSDQYTTTISSTRLSKLEITQVRQYLHTKDTKPKTKPRKARSRTGGVRAEEEITIIFDQNKSILYSLYSRARRKNPGLKGKIVLEITIAPGGKVTKVRIVFSELHDRKLEKRIVARIKQFKFGSQNVESITVTYPIEFLPS